MKTHPAPLLLAALWPPLLLAIAHYDTLRETHHHLLVLLCHAHPRPLPDDPA